MRVIKRAGAVLPAVVLGSILVFSIFGQDPSQRINPDDLIYLGAFRLPPGDPASDLKSWAYGGHALAYYLQGDPDGPEDGFPGSLFGTGHAWGHFVSEFSIPVPVISQARNALDLNTAVILQDFTDVLEVTDLEIPRSGLAILPPQGDQIIPKLYFCWGYHMQEFSPDLTHGWCELDLSDPKIRGGWFLSGLPTYLRNLSTNDYLCEIPEVWAELNTQGMRLATGRYRDGGWSGQGPALFAVGPWQEGNPPPSGTGLSQIPLLLYTSSYEASGIDHVLNSYHHSDEWSGAAWLKSGECSALIFIGTKGEGECWYGNPEGPCLECDNRGWWSDEFHGKILFYDTQELADVARGFKQPWEPQPYATKDIDSVLWHITSPQQKHHVNADCFDAEHGRIYVFEPLSDGDKPIVHVWELVNGSDEPEDPEDPDEPVQKKGKKGKARR